MKMFTVSLFAFSCVINASSLKNYLDLKKEAIINLQNYNASSDLTDQNELKKIEKLALIGIAPPSLRKFSNFGLTLQTLQPEQGFNQLDGLISNNKNEILFITSLSLLEKYSYENSKSKPEDDFLSGALAWKIFSPSAASEVFGTIFSVKNRSHVLVSLLTGFGQDIGPYPPNAIITYFISGKKVAALYTELNVDQINVCKVNWTSAKSRGIKRFDMVYENKIYEEYKLCFIKELVRTGDIRTIRLKSNISEKYLIELEKTWRGPLW
jgi:hypothetical protein